MNNPKSLLFLGLCPPLLALALWGMGNQTPAPAVSEPPTSSTIPVLLPTSVEAVTIPPETIPPEDEFEVALGQSRWEEADWEIIRLIVQCESSGDARAVGRAGEMGLLQIHPGAHPELAAKYDLFDPSQNLNAGFEVYEEQGFGAWSCWEGAE